MNRQLLIIILFLTPLFLQAGVIPVSSLSDAGAGSLREATIISNNNDTIDLSAVSGTIFLNSQIVIRKNLLFKGPGATVLTLDGREKNRIFWIDTNKVVTISDITFDHGNAYLDSTDVFTSGGAIRNFGRLTLNNCLIQNCFAGFGGAIHNYGYFLPDDTIRLNLNSCTFINNKVDPPLPNLDGIPRSGGAIYADARLDGFAPVTAKNCHFLNNSAAENGGAICIFADRGDTVRMLTLLHCTITGNIARNKGGAIFQEEGVNFIQSTIIAENDGQPDNPNVHGALFSHGGTLVDRITLNSSVAYRANAGAGADLFNVNPDLGNIATQVNGLPGRVPRCESPVVGAGIFSAGSPLDMRGVSRPAMPSLGACEPSSDDKLVTNLNDDGFGSLRYAMTHSCSGDTLDLRNLSGILFLDSALHAEREVLVWGNPRDPLVLKGRGKDRLLNVDSEAFFKANFLSFNNGISTQYGGGAIRNFGKLELYFCSFYDNEAPSGGAIGTYGQGDSTAYSFISTSSFSSNRATTLDGGAIENVPINNEATTIIEHCTIAENEAFRRGGALFNLGEAKDMEVSLSIVADNRAAEGADLYGMFSSNRGHNLLADTSYTFGMPPLGSNSIVTTNAGLEPFGNFYGGPSRCYALAAGSPAIDGGTTMTSSVVDQRGFIRMFGTNVDIGAYEYNPLTSLAPSEVVSIQAFPNPGNGPVELLGEALSSMDVVSVTSIDGKVLLKENISVNNDRHTLQIPSMAPGLYYVVLEGKSGRYVIALMRN